MASIKLSRYEAEEGDLPDVCMCCGAEATERKRRRFTSHPFWVYVLLPWGWIPYAIVASILTEHIRCYTLFCPRHKNHFFVRNLIVWGSLVLILPIIFGSFIIAGSLSKGASRSTEDILFGLACLGSVVLLLGWLISIPISQATAIHPANATERHLILKRVSPEFVDAVRQYRANRKERAQAEDYREHFRPRRPPPHDRREDDEVIEGE